MVRYLLTFISAETQYFPAIAYVKRCNDCKIGRKTSCHKISLAIDIDLYDEHGNYITDPAAHEKIHDYWDQLGGAKRIAHDMNHYSLAHNGMR